MTVCHWRMEGGRLNVMQLFLTRRVTACFTHSSGCTSCTCQTQVVSWYFHVRFQRRIVCTNARLLVRGNALYGFTFCILGGIVLRAFHIRMAERLGNGCLTWRFRCCPSAQCNNLSVVLDRSELVMSDRPCHAVLLVLVTCVHISRKTRCT